MPVVVKDNGFNGEPGLTGGIVVIVALNFPI